MIHLDAQEPTLLLILGDDLTNQAGPSAYLPATFSKMLTHLKHKTFEYVPAFFLFFLCPTFSNLCSTEKNPNSLA